MTELETLIAALTAKKPLVAMVAPSFPVMYPYPAIVTMLRRLGFRFVVEVAVGGRKTNEELLAQLETNPNARFITSPCPTIVRLIRTQMPELAKYFPVGVDSPMVATAKICADKFPDCQPVFIGPCIVKRLEAAEDFPQLNILVINYGELAQIFRQFNIAADSNPQDKFDLAEASLIRTYPLDGGLAQSSGVIDKLGKDAVKIVSGWKNCQQAIKDFEANPQIRLLDILFCDGGCIGGPGIKSDLSTQERKKKILDYYTSNQGVA